MSHEQEPSNSEEHKLVFPSQQTPYPGVFEDVYAEYLEDPDEFRFFMISKMNNDNPNFVGLFSAATIFSPMPHLTMKWISIYYEIFARSNEIRELPPVFLTEKLLEEDTRLLKIRHQTVLQGNYEGAIRFLEKEKERRLRDEALSPELSLFWQSVDRDIENEIANGTDELDTLKCIAPLINLQELLQKQDDEYVLAEHYSSK